MHTCDLHRALKDVQDAVRCIHVQLLGSLVTDVAVIVGNGVLLVGDAIFGDGAFIPALIVLVLVEEHLDASVDLILLCPKGWC